MDYRNLNDITKKDQYPLPRIDDILDTIGKSQYFSSLDQASGYWQIGVAPEDKEKTAFTTFNGLYEFQVLPFGLCNAPSTYQRLLYIVLRGLQWSICLVYLDDILIFSNNFSDHVKHLERVFARLKEAGLKLKLAKCQFGMKELTFLGIKLVHRVCNLMKRKFWLWIT